jgi:hypothetical protein
MRRWGELDKRRKVAHGELPASAIRRGRPPGKKSKTPKTTKTRSRRRKLEDDDDEEEPDLDDEEDDDNDIEVPVDEDAEEGEPKKKKRRPSQFSKVAREDDEVPDTDFDEVINTEVTVTRSGRKTRRVVTGQPGGGERM